MYTKVANVAMMARLSTCKARLAWFMLKHCDCNCTINTFEKQHLLVEQAEASLNICRIELRQTSTTDVTDKSAETYQSASLECLHQCHKIPAPCLQGVQWSDNLQCHLVDMKGSPRYVSSALIADLQIPSDLGFGLPVYASTFWGSAVRFHGTIHYGLS